MQLCNNPGYKEGVEHVCVGKQVKVVHGAQAPWYQTVWCVTVGAGVCFGAAKGQTLKEAGQKARRVWVDKSIKLPQGEVIVQESSKSG